MLQFRCAIDTISVQMMPKKPDKQTPSPEPKSLRDRKPGPNGRDVTDKAIPQRKTIAIVRGPANKPAKPQ